MVRALLSGMLVFFATIVTFAGNNPNEVRVQIMHNDELVFDTTFTAPADSARMVIERCVYNYSKDSIFLNPNSIQGLYVFNVSNEYWNNQQAPLSEAPKTASEPKPATNQIAAEELWPTEPANRNQWESITIDMFVDTLSTVIQELKQEFVKIDFKNDPTVQEISSSLREVFTQIKNTRIMVVPQEEARKEEE